MPDRRPQYRFRGNIAPSAEVARPAAARHNETTTSNEGASQATSATLDIFDVIDSWGGWWGISARDVDAALQEIGNVDTLYVRLNSPGGEALEGVAIGNMLRAHAATIRVTVYGLAASAASAVAMAGDVVNMAPGSMMMIHDAWNIVLGDPAELRAEADILDKLSDGYAALYAAKAGGTVASWRTLMQAETWYSAADAVAAKLADAVAVDPAPQITPAAVEPAELVELVDVGFDSAAARFDLTVFAHAPTPARAQSTRNPTDPEEDGSMPDTIPTAGVCRALGLPSDADEATVLAALNQALEERAEPDPAPDPAPVAAVPEGHVVVSQLVLDELRENAAAGREARAQQLREARDEAIDAAVNDGRISRARVDAWRTSWDRDPDGTKADLDSLQPRFPVANATGYAGSDQSDGAGTKPFTDEEGDALAALAGLPQGVLR